MLLELPIHFEGKIDVLQIVELPNRNKLLAEFKLEDSVERSLRKLLEVENYKQRSFEKLKRHVGGFTDDELRKYLVRAGAVRFSNGDKEMWGLVSRNTDRLE